MSKNYELIRNASVEVKHVVDDKRHTVAEITVNDKHQHRFPSTSRYSKHLQVMTAGDLQERLNGGTFMFIDDTLVDLRDGHYNGFVHTDESIDQFMDIIGYRNRSEMPLHRRRRSGSDDITNISLSKVWSANEIEIPGYHDGGNMTTSLSFAWNPFVKTINSDFDVIRQICTNGMVGMTSLINSRVPLFNRWEEHLHIAARQVQNKVSDIIIKRMQMMSKMRASVADCLLITQHASARIQSQHKLPGEDTVLVNLISTTSPIEHLSKWYAPAVFADRNIASQLPSHLTVLDLYNIATEMRSHTSEVPASTNHALDRMSNSMLFDATGVETGFATNLSAPRVSPFSCPDRAFFSDLS